jgi:pre-mRNA-splicing helicase BRR2
MQLPIDLATDQEIILTKVLALLSATVDVLSSDGHLNAMNAMEMSQMVVQGMWDRDSPLKQIPHFTPEVIKAANDSGYVCPSTNVDISTNHHYFCSVTDIFEFMDAMDPSENPNYATLVDRLGLSQTQLAQAAHFTNAKYPNIELDFELEEPEDITAGAPAYIKVKIVRDVDVEDESTDVDTTVHAPFYPVKKMENWWLVVGDEKSKALLAIKRVTISRSLTVRLEYTVPTPGKHELKLFLMSDSYVGVDQDPSFEITVAEGMDEDEDEEEEEGEES